MGACAEEIEVSAISIRIAVSSNDLRIMKGCLQPLNIILECRKAATMTFLSSDRRMVPRDYAPTHRCHRDRLCFSWRRSVPILHRNGCAGCAEGALDLESVTIPVFNQTHEALMRPWWWGSFGRSSRGGFGSCGTGPASPPLGC